MSTLLTADIHLNDKPRDEYRWSLFQWLSEQEADELVINGDLTDAKDRHSAKLVNRLFSEIMKLEPKFRVIINRGNHDCHSVDTELLSRRGWIKHDEICEDDEVVGLNEATGKGEWQRINKVIYKEVEELWETVGRGYDICCSSNHRVFTERSGSYYYNRPSDVPKSHRIVHSVVIDHPDIDLSDDEIKLMAWILTDGMLQQNNMAIYQSKRKFVREIDDLCKRLDLSPRRRVRHRVIKEICGKALKSESLPSVTWIFSRVETRRLCLRLGLRENHKIPDCVFLFSPAQFGVFLDEVLKADGHVYKNRGSWLAALHKSYEFLSQIQALLHVFGYRGVLSETVNGHWVLSISTRILSGRNVLMFNKRACEKQLVWCLSVSLSNFLVRRNGKAYLTGNCLDPNHPFFEFLGSSSDCLFVTKPTQLKMSIGSALFVPAGVRWDFEIPKVDYLFTHATFSGAKAENGRTLTGVDPGVLKGFKGRVISGDIHTPQKLSGGQIEYCGAPYHTRFGDEYDPRVMLVANDGSARDLHFPAPRKHVFTVTEPDHLLNEKAGRGDHVKVRCLLRRADYDRWRDYQKKIREIADERGWLLFGSEPVPLEVSSRNDSAPQVEVAAADQLVENYAREQKASRAYAEAGVRLLKEGVS